ncbi:sodium:calcium antiporter [Emcibacter nanhaiensis]|uniref:Sodium:calcium antiporter n=1 Tax=Emcibacter nanhaiensis TaxID=1505037 RepID=A0A501PMP4_9PROT|nr:sodium:calcium antiporter [Emcibacter nanhaiensis]TPD61719.1 sodium:calcium antiporter [Emcibacter nanhaiensis]
MDLSSFFHSLPMAFNLLLFCAFATVIWFTGTRLSYLVDALAEQTKIARALMGLGVLAIITELPEMVTTVTAALAGNAELALNNMFGGISMQTAILAVADMFVVHAALTTYPRKPTPVIEGLFLILMLTFLLLLFTTGDTALPGGIGLSALLLAGLYLLSIFIIQKFVTAEVWSPVDLPNPEEEQEGAERNNHYDHKPLSSLYVAILLSAVFILVIGVLLTHTAETLADQTGLGSSFIGVTLLAATTSLPELSTTIAAVRIRAYTMAISNILGSNLIMVFLILPADIFYRPGPILNEIDYSAALALGSGILVTAIYCLGLLIRRKGKIFKMGVDSALVLLVYLASLGVFYWFR